MTHLAPLDYWLKAPVKELRESAFEASQFASEQISSEGLGADGARDIVIRLRALLDVRHEDISDFAPMIEALTREVGLFPYIDEKFASFSDLIAKEAFRSEFDDDLVFHIEQQRIFSSLQKGNNVVASAPTSFGKSLIIDSLIGQPKIRRAALIVPTLALLDEARRRIVRKTKGATTVIFNKSQPLPKEGKLVFLGTQERLIDRDDIEYLDILIVDEFYKADPYRADARFVILNAAISKLSRISKQFFMIGPYIDGIDAKVWRYVDVDFIKTSYRSVSVDTIDVESSRGNVDKLASLLVDDANTPALIFVKSPKSAGDLAKSLIAAGVRQPTPWSQELSDWLSLYYTPDWGLVESLKHGIAYHHGRLPRSVASTMVRGFNDGVFKILICTSTLIEGVNTVAKSVFVWDKKIDGKDIDFFTYSNIRGRAGRMGTHYVGKVYRFHPEPEARENEVTVPGLAISAHIDEIAVHFDESEDVPEVHSKIDDWIRQTGLNRDQLKRYSALGFPRLQKLKNAIEGLSESELRYLEWKQLPQYDQLKATCELIWQVFDLTRSGAKGASQLTFFIWRLYKASSFRVFLTRMLRSEQPAYVEDLFAFLRSCEFSIPEMIACAEVSLQRNKNLKSSYGLFVARLENWFLSPNVKSLEETGFPIILYERLGLRFSEETLVEDFLKEAFAEAQKRADILPVEIRMIADSI